MKTTACLPVLLLLLSGCSSGPIEMEPAGSVHVPSFILREEGPLPLSVFFVEGYEPSPLALDALNQTIRQVASRPTSIAIYQRIDSPPGDRSPENLHEIRDGLPQAFPAALNSLRIVYLDGTSPRGSHEAAGVHSRGTIFVFLDTLDSDLMVGVQASGLGLNQLRPYSERSVLIHEFGHALGLVNCGIPMLASREDPESRCHSLQEDSVMHGLSYLSSRPQQVLYAGVEPLWKFNEADLQDIRSFRNAPPEPGSQLDREGQPGQPLTA